MLQPTHGAAGVLAAELVLLQFDIPLMSWEAAAGVLIGCIAGPLADIDKQGSIMAKIFFPVSALLRVLKIKHRTFTHSLAFLLVLGVLAVPMPPLYYWIFLAAYASHPLIDLFNEQGVQLLWPLKLKIRLLPRFMAVDTGSTGEVMFRWLLIAAGVWLILQDAGLAFFTENMR
ncbi:inner membrane protein [Paenibacillus sp. UNCCL117]|uniref:metal-dependent hydrolase n=1 Tax=unclassified Paenibacillus TaxID=185978 RepID=UPI00088DA91F|nr:MULTISPECIES: metal-dependent hydrolase [unclassified Paenibacillus]SDD58645.1 inner membrane protein [Paenibacillus sp. cl123]SFW50972.1 inner membrane protein [Paenibacillus sp. UNCCL117]